MASMATPAHIPHTASIATTVTPMNGVHVTHHGTTIATDATMVPVTTVGTPFAFPFNATAKHEPHQKRITVWNKKENRKISGNAAPMENNLHDYLAKHPDCEVYAGQGGMVDPAARAAQQLAEKRITIWNRVERRKVSGNAAPLEKNLKMYLKKHPEYEVYTGQERSRGEGHAPTQQQRMSGKQAWGRAPVLTTEVVQSGHVPGDLKTASQLIPGAGSVDPLTSQGRPCIDVFGMSESPTWAQMMVGTNLELEAELLGTSVSSIDRIDEDEDIDEGKAVPGDPLGKFFAEHDVHMQTDSFIGMPPPDVPHRVLKPHLERQQQQAMPIKQAPIAIPVAHSGGADCMQSSFGMDASSAQLIKQDRECQKTKTPYGSWDADWDMDFGQSPTSNNSSGAIGGPSPNLNPLSSPNLSSGGQSWMMIDEDDPGL